MSDLPQGWAVATLGEISASVKNGIYISRPGTDTDGVAILRINAVRQLELRLDDLRYSGTSERDLRDRDALLREGDLLFTRYSGSEDYVGVCAVVPQFAQSLTYPDKLIRARLEESISSDFVAYAFASSTVRADVEAALRTTAGQVGVAGRDLKRARIPIPPQSEQCRIVRTLSQLLSQVNAADRLVRRQEIQLDLAMESYLSAKMSPTWLESPVGDLLERSPSNGRSVPTALEGFPVLRLTALRNGRVDLAERKVGAWTAEQAKPHLVRKGDVLVSRGNGSVTLVGRAALVIDEPDPVAYPDTIVRLAPDESRFDSRFLVAIWNSRIVRDQIESAARTTAGIHKINHRIIEKVRVPVPPLDQQQEIVAQLDVAREGLDRLRTQGHVKITACAGFVTLSDELWNTAALVFPAQSTRSLRCSL